MVAGPLVGAGLYSGLGFMWTFIIYSIFFFAGVPLFYFLLGEDREYKKE